MRANVINPTHPFPKTNYFPSSTTSSTLFHQPHCTSQFQTINRSAFNYFTHYTPHLQRPWSKDCHLTSRRHSFWSFLTAWTCRTVGDKLQLIVRLPWPCCLSWQLDQCQPQSWYNTPTDSKRTWWWLHWRATRHCNSRTAMAQRHCFGKTGSRSCR